MLPLLAATQFLRFILYAIQSHTPTTVDSPFALALWCYQRCFPLGNEGDMFLLIAFPIRLCPKLLSILGGNLESTIARTFRGTSVFGCAPVTCNGQRTKVNSPKYHAQDLQKTEGGETAKKR